MIDPAEVSSLCRRVSGYLRTARLIQASDWYQRQAELVERGGLDAELMDEVHRSISAGAGGPLGVVITDGSGRADQRATEEYKATLDRLYVLTRRSRIQDFFKSLRG